MATTTARRLIYERDAADDAWSVRVDGLSGYKARGRTIAEARRRIERALDGGRRVSLTDDVRLPSRVRTAVERCHAARAEAEASRERAQRATALAVKMLTEELRLSRRDAASILGLSHQRVQQLRP